MQYLQAAIGRTDQLRGEVRYACPDCPIPGAVGPNGLIQPPRPFCRTCAGTALVTAEQLDRWEARQWRELPV